MAPVWGVDDRGKVEARRPVRSRITVIQLNSGGGLMEEQGVVRLGTSESLQLREERQESRVTPRLVDKVEEKNYHLLSGGDCETRRGKQIGLFEVPNGHLPRAKGVQFQALCYSDFQWLRK